MKLRDEDVRGILAWGADGHASPLDPEEVAALCAELLALRAENARMREAPASSKAAQDVIAERQRQVRAEGWTPQHDDEHSCGELADAAACYAAPAPHGIRITSQDDPPKIWPWHRNWWKPKDRRSNLVRAGALILAEIERLDRAAIKGGE